MARTISDSPRRRGWTLIPPALTLARWQLRATWRLLLLAGVGMLAAVALVASVPLFSQVATSAGVRAALVNDLRGADITLAVRTTTITPDLQQQALMALAPVLQRDVGRYLGGTPHVSLQTPHLALATVQGQVAHSGDVMRMVGIDPAQAQTAVMLTSGTFPTAASGPLQIALNAATALALHAQIGARITFAPRISTSTPDDLTAQVVGIFIQTDPNAPLWYDEDFTPRPAGQTGTAYGALTANPALLAFAARALPTVAQSSANGNEPAALLWDYPVNLDQMSATPLDTLIRQITALQVESNNALSTLPGVNYVDVGSGLSALDTLQNRVVAIQVPITLLLAQVLALAIFFVSLMTDIVIEQQTDAIALLRSRGADRRQIVGALALQTGGLASIAALAGPFVAIGVVRLAAWRLLGSGDQSALAGNPLALAWSLRWYSDIAVVSAFVAMLIGINRALGANVLDVRREAARSTHRPLWQRIYLDMLFAVIGLIGYVSYVLALGQVPPQYQSALSPLALVAPLFLLLATVLLFLRLFPLLLRAGAWLAGRSRFAAPMLALAQMARTPRRAMRLTLLLALTTAFALFILVFVASQDQHTRDVAAFTVGADFNGTLAAPTVADAPAPQVQAARYAAIPGVTSATIGYRASVAADTNAASVQVMLQAVDADTYAQTTIWPTSNSRPSIAALMDLLQTERPQVSRTDVVPAIVDDAMWQGFSLGQEPHFILHVPGANASALHLLAVAHVAHISGIFDASGNTGTGGVLVDLPSYTVALQHDTTTVVQQNTIWLRTTSDPATLATIRAALSTGPLQISALADRRAIIAAAQRDPLVIDLLGILEIGVVMAGLLGLVGALTASWLSAQSRLTNFAVLRALGGSPRQVAGVLLWEQSLIYGIGLGLGIGLGFVLAGAVLPVLIFTNGIAGADISQQTINVPPIQTVLPLATIALMLAGVALIFIVMQALMTRIVARPSLSQTLRLNED